MCDWRSYLKYVFILKICIHLSVSDKMISDKSQEGISVDFGNFLKTLGSMVYKSNKEEHAQSRRNELIYTSTSRTLWKKENDNDHRDALGDMLMLKLVSYYENKYKISHADFSTDPPTNPTTENTTTKKYRNSNIIKTTERSDLYDQNYDFITNNDAVAEVVII